MAEDVCDSWEDLDPEKSEALDKKLEQLKLNGDTKKKKSPIKILQRPSSSPDCSNVPGNSNSCSGRKSLNANSEPFVPKGALLPTPTTNIEIEGSSKTQYQPKLVILKREKKNDPKSSEGSTTSSRPAPPQKSYEEREADYMRARERILGSSATTVQQPNASATTATPPDSSQRASSSCVIRPQLGQPEVPLLRQPQGPSVDGGKGFLRTKR